MPREIQVAVVGVGYWGTKLVETLSRTEGVWVRLAWDCQPDVRREVKRRYPQVAVTASWEEVLGDRNLDAVVLATPPSTHYPMAREALAAGKHAWVEKPLALHYWQGQELVALAHEAGRVLFVDETFLYDPLLQRAKELLVSGTIGGVYHVSLQRTGMGRIRRDSNVWWNSAPHDLSILRYLIDQPVHAVSAIGHAYVQVGIEDVVWAALQLADRISVHLYLNWLFPERKAPLTVVGETGMVRYEGRFEQRTLSRYAYRLGPVRPPEIPHSNLVPIEQSEAVEVIHSERPEPLFQACTAFRNSILKGEPVSSSGDRSLSTLAVLEAGTLSLARQGAWVEVAEVLHHRRRGV
jgi:predicted dehydrogenase